MVDNVGKTEYNMGIIQKSSHSNYSAETQRDLVLDTAENLTQIGQWSLQSFSRERSRIELFLKLTRKNLNALSNFPLSPAFDPSFKKFSNSFTRLEKQYREGIVDPENWAHGMLVSATTLTQSVKFI